MRVRIELASPRDGDWYVVSEGTYLVGFSGLHARELALKHQQELTHLLNFAAAAPTSAADGHRSTVIDERGKSSVENMHSTSAA